MRDEKKFEEKCMDVIEMIVGIDKKLDRKGAIAVSQKMLEKAKQKTTNQNVLDIYERVINEFKIATNEEYNMLRDQIFADKERAGAGTAGKAGTAKGKK